MALARWAQWPLRGSPWALKYPYCHQLSPKPIPGATEGFGKSQCEKISKCH